MHQNSYDSPYNSSGSESDSSTVQKSPQQLEVAVIGGGIIGMILAAGLTRQGIKFTLYEQARNFRELGAGIGFTRNTVKCMELINPDIVTALRDAGAVNVSIDPVDPNAYFRWVDGYTQHKIDDPSYQKLLCKLDAGPLGWEIVRRDHFLENLNKLIPDHAVRLRHRVVSIEQPDSGGQLTLTFADGTNAHADAGS